MQTAEECMERFLFHVVPLMILNLQSRGFTEEQVREVIVSMREAFAEDTEIQAGTKRQDG